VSDEFISFDKALDDLRLKEEELKRLVSEGEIRAFRKGETMKLRQSDVDALRMELGGEVVDLGDADEELVFEDDDLEGDSGMATQEISDIDTLLEEEIEDVGEIELDDEMEEVEQIEDLPAAAAIEEEEEMHPALLGAVLVSVGLMVLFGAVAMSLASGSVSGTAEAVGGIFGVKF
jgi:hypothetical protein